MDRLTSAAERRLLEEAVREGAAGRLTRAEGLFRSLLARNAASPEAFCGLASVLAAMGREAEALGWFDRALALAPNDAQTLNNYGGALTALERTADAVRAYERAVSQEPRYAAAWHNLGHCLTVEGRLEEARYALQQAVALAPGNGEFHRSLALAAPFRQGDPRLDGMEAALGEPGLSRQDREELHYALGKAYDDLGRPDDSLDQFLAGAALVRARTAYDEAATLEGFSRIAGVFSEQMMARDAADTAPGPVFIVGMPRSGTTLAEQMLASHPQVHGAGERTDLPRIVAELGARFPGGARDLGAADWARIGQRYLSGVRAPRPDALRIIDKMPGNFRYLGLIALALPGAKVIHVRRDPADTCLSCFTTLFRGAQPYSYDLAELGRYYRAYEGLMEHWRGALPAGIMTEVAYEDLVAGPERELRRLLAFLDLEWDPACLTFHKTSRSVMTASAAQVRRPLYATSVGRWRAHGPRLAPLLGALEQKV